MTRDDSKDVRGDEIVESIIEAIDARTDKLSLRRRIEVLTRVYERLDDTIGVLQDVEEDACL
jgi:hypothetical protein